jgi:hypothetical protein
MSFGIWAAGVEWRAMRATSPQTGDVRFGICRDGVAASFNPQPGYPLAGGVGIRLRLPAPG